MFFLGLFSYFRDVYAYVSGTYHQAAYWHCMYRDLVVLLVYMWGNLPVFPGVVTVVRVVAVPLPPTGVN